MNAYDTGFLDGKRQQSKEDISEFLEDIHYVWNNHNDFIGYMERKKKWEKRSKE